ncbi:hypothetical protein WS98_25230 [Burkholderia territorii]|nr:hypothetical protein WS51_17850 [Burkholderia territorii]KVL29731.1 hypothetical protein WS98_25230 [Burkholderia territorii]KWH15883.1 hypothetical protein WT59_08830 [Burkholderia territorii]
MAATDRRQKDERTLTRSLVAPAESGGHVVVLLQVAGAVTQLEIVENMLPRLVPIVETLAMIATAINPAIRPYSIAVTPSSSLKKRLMSAFIF